MQLATNIHCFFISYINFEFKFSIISNIIKIRTKVRSEVNEQDRSFVLSPKRRHIYIKINCNSLKTDEGKFLILVLVMIDSGNQKHR